MDKEYAGYVEKVKKFFVDLKNKFMDKIIKVHLGWAYSSSLYFLYSFTSILEPVAFIIFNNSSLVITFSS